MLKIAFTLNLGTPPGAFLTVNIPEQYFFYKVRNNQILEIRPDQVPGGAPQGILEQIGITRTTL